MSRVLSILLGFSLTTFILFSAASYVRAQTFVGPKTSAGVGTGAIGVNSASNISIGTSTPLANTKFIVVASSTDTSSYGLQVLQPNQSPIFVVRNDGSLGIGTSTPAYPLTVSGSVYSTSNITAGGTISGTNYSGTVNAGNVTAGVFGAGNFAFPSSLGIATSSQVGLPQSLSVYGGGYFSGNVGIGTTNPGSKLNLAFNDVSSGQDFGSILMTSNANPSAYFERIASYRGAYSDLMGWRFTVQVGSGVESEAMRIAPNGSGGFNVGIGTTGPSNPLTVKQASTAYGIATYSPSSDAYVRIRHDGTRGIIDTTYDTTAGYTDLWLNTSNAATPRIAITASGNVGIGTTNPGSKLSVAGDFYLNPSAGTTGFDMTSNGIFEIDSAGVHGGRFRVLENGNVGIGTTGPANKLDVAGTGDFTTSLSVGTTTQSGALNVLGNANISGTLTAGTLSGSYSGTIGANNVTAGVFGAGNFAFPSSLGIATSSQVGLPQALSVYGGGYFSSNVGIGATSPGISLSVHRASVSNIIQVTSDSSIYWTAIGISPDNNASAWYWYTDRASRIQLGKSLDVNSFVTVTDSGNVGIGTAGPNQKLEVYGVSPQIRASYSGNYVEFGIGWLSQPYNAGIWFNGTQQVSFVNKGMALGDYAVANNPGPPANGAIIPGNVGIGTTIPGNQLEVKSSASNLNNWAVYGYGGNYGIRGDGSTYAGYFVGPVYMSGNANITGTLTAGTLSGSYSGTINASNVTAGVFGAGNFAFPSSLGIATSSQVGLPQSLSVYGGGYFSGNVGIGTTGPTRLVTLNASNYPYLSFNESGAEKTVIGSETSSGRRFIVYDSNATLYRIVVDNSGNVGIGTTGPGNKLDVAGSIQISGTGFAGAGDGIGKGAAGELGIVNSGSYALYTKAGNVGIGTTSPTEKLSVNGNILLGAGNYIWTDGGAYSRIWRPGYAIGSVAYNGQYGTNITYLAQYTAGWTCLAGGTASSLGIIEGGALVFSNGPCSSNGAALTWTDRFVINSAGNVGIGTTGPTDTDGYNGKVLDVIGPGYFRQNSDATKYLSFGTSGGNSFLEANGTGNLLRIYTAGSERVRIDTSGNVGIGTTGPGYTLDVNGTFSATIKNFDIQYPFDPSKRLVHSTLEGPEVAVFYRGESQLSNGRAEVRLPDYFEALTRKEGRTVLLTSEFDSTDESVSTLAASYVVDGKFVVKAVDNNNPNQKFYWEVKAVRADVPQLQVVRELSK